MKSGKLTKLLAMLIALTAVVITGCANESSSGDGNGKGSEKTFKVELGDIPFADYEEYDTWRYGSSPSPIISFDVLKAKRDELYGKTLDGTYQDKGSLTASELKTFLTDNGQDADVAADAIKFADTLGNEITFLFLDDTYATETWVYIEK